MYIKGCLSKSRGTCTICGKGSLAWLLGSSWQGHGNSSNTPSLRVGQPLLCCLSFEIWLLPKERQREGEGDYRMDGYFCMAPRQKVWWQKMAPTQSKLQRVGEDVTRPVATNDQINIYHLKKQTIEKLNSQARNTHNLNRVLL
jgi:hypothetical protein